MHALTAPRRVVLSHLALGVTDVVADLVAVREPFALLAPDIALVKVVVENPRVVSKARGCGEIFSLVDYGLSL